MLKKITSINIIVFIVMGVFVSAETKLDLTQEEKDYIAKADVIGVVSVDGWAPIQYTDTRGEIRGVSKRVLEEISNMTGLTFQYKMCGTIREACDDTDSDIFFGIPYHYASSGMVLSRPFLKTGVILYINSSIDFKQLDNKIYAAVRGRVFSEGVKEENIVYFDTREKSLDAVERGEADYGYGNIYSVIFYTSKNNYKNIVTIPMEKEIREYRMGFLKNDKVLLSIINKAIDAINESKIQAIILDETTHIDRKITFSMVMDTYGRLIFGVVFLVIGILSFSVISNVRSNKRFKTQNKINEMLSQISNEYLYEYFVKSDRLELSKKYTQLFGTPEQQKEASNILKNTLKDNDLDGNISEIRLPIIYGETCTFKSIGLNMYDKKGNLDFIVGKMIDISEEIEEKEKLIIKSKMDGLTGIYNAITTRELINEAIKNRDKHAIDALIIIDCDNLKYINDTYGHLVGNRVLKNISTGLKLTFRQNDIIGRVGGDEFCVYMKNVPSIDLIKLKCDQLNKLIQQINEDFFVSVSSGMALLEEEDTYEELFGKADKVLYEAKKDKGIQFIKYFKI